MSWGKGIIVVFAVFLSGLAFMAYTSMRSESELVARNYYEKELKYQEQIDKINYTKGKNKNVEVVALPGKVVVIFPKSEFAAGIRGEISFYRPSDSKIDFIVPVEADSNSEQVILTDKINKGLWKVMINWNSGSGEYYKEERIMVQ